MIHNNDNNQSEIDGVSTDSPGLGDDDDLVVEGNSILEPDSRREKPVSSNKEAELLDDTSHEPLTFGAAVTKGIGETLNTLNAFIHAPKEILGLNIINILEGMAYFGTLTYLVLYMHENIGVSDTVAAFSVSLFTMTITISQLLFGGVSDKLGAKRALGIALCCLLISRFVVGFAEPVLGAAGGSGLGSPLFVVVIVALLFGALSYGLYQPSIYAVTREYSDERTSAVSYAMLYAGMNLGAFVMGLVLPWVRRESASVFDNNGYTGSLCFLAFLMIFALGAYFVFIKRSKAKAPGDGKESVIESVKEEAKAVEEPEHVHLSFIERLKRHPLADLKFDFFIFILIPVQTLFAYQNILIPTYLTRCFDEYPTISDNFETFSNLNPLIVFVTAPIIAALTARANVYKMMIIGTTVMALPTFLLVFGQTPFTFLTFVLIMSIGESMWQPRFLQHVAEIAPKDKVGAYIGIAQLPWFLTKFIVGLYAGYFMEHFIPAGADQNPELMWFIFACIAMISPVALFLARNWCNVTKKASQALG